MIPPLRPGSRIDIAQLEALLIECSVSDWTAVSLRQVIGNPEYDLAVAGDLGSVSGFVITRSAGVDAEILLVCVALARRRQGMGSRLLKHALEWAANRGCNALFLEVRSRNRSAIALYRQHGFETCGCRAGYYRDPDDDGLIMRLDLAPDMQLARGTEVEA